MKIRHGIVTLIMAAAAAICMSGCNIGNFYSNANKYTSGDREITDEISQIDINWTSGSVSVFRSAPKKASSPISRRLSGSVSAPSGAA